MKPPRSVALLGPDVILLAMEMLAGGSAASSNAALVLELDDTIDPERVGAALARFLPLCPWLGGRLVRPRPWGRLAWRVPRRGPTQPAVRTTTLAPGTLGGLVDRELAAAIDPRHEPPLRVTIADEGGTSRLVLTWAHALMDPHGSEHLVRLLADVDAHPESGTPPWPTPPIVIAPADERPLRERGALASQSAAQLKTLMPVPPLSLAAAGRGTSANGPRHWRFRFAAAAERGRRGMPWRLAVVAAAMTPLFQARGLASDRPFLIPVSANRRRRGEPGPVLGNFLAFHFARALPPTDGDIARLARALRDQLAAAVRNDELEAGWAGMSFARYRPLRGMFRELPWTKAGDFCSFHFADTETVLPDRTHLFGAGIVDGYHVAAVPARPGAGVFFSRRGATENLIVSTTNGVLDDADAATVADVVQREMGWERVTG